MAKWVRVHIGSASDSHTNAYVDLEQYGFVRVELDSLTSKWVIRASTVPEGETASIWGSWNSLSEASQALFVLLTGSQTS